MWCYVISKDGAISRLFMTGSEIQSTIAHLLNDGNRILWPLKDQEAELINGKLYWKDLVAIGE